MVEEELGRVSKAVAAYIEASNENFKRVKQRQERPVTQVAESKADVADYDAKIADSREAIAYFERCIFRDAAIRYADDVVMEMGAEFVRTLTRSDLRRMAQNEPDVVQRDQLDSFCKADLVIESTLAGKTQYVAVETSFEATAVDAERATRNANFLTHLTGCLATPAVASVKKNPALDSHIGSGRLYWYQIVHWDGE